MRKFYSLVPAVVFLLAGMFYFFKNNGSTYTPRQQDFDFYQAATGKGINGALEWHRIVKANRTTGTIDINDVFAAEDQVDILSRKKSRALNMVWEEMGPANIGGRTRAFLIDTNCNRFFAGGVAGGLWYSDNEGGNWHSINDTAENLAVSCIAMGPNGDIYYGTGEGFANPSGENYNSGTIGRGIFKSTSACGTTINFVNLPSTNPKYISANAGNDAGQPWSKVYDIAVHPTNPNTIYAGLINGLRVSEDGGQTWLNNYILNSAGTPLAGRLADIEIGSDGSFVVVAGNAIYRSPDGSSKSFVNISPSGMGPIERIEVAIAPGNPSVIYAIVADALANNGSRLGGVWISENSGTSWTKIGQGSENPSAGDPFVFEPFGELGQGWYDNIGWVNPANPGEFYLGGVELWRWKKVNLNPVSGEWTKIAVEFPDHPSNPFYVHADKHNITNYPGDPNRILFLTDGGVFQTENRAVTYFPQNRNYNVTQFYSVGFSGSGEVVGGTQDNGSQYIEPLLGEDSKELTGGDGGYADISVINSDYIFSTLYYGALFRSDDRGTNMNRFDSPALDTIINSISTNSFVTPIRLWESFNDPLSPDSVYFKNNGENALPGGTVIQVNSLTAEYPFNFTLPFALGPGDSILVPDPVQAQLALGLGASIWVCVNPVSFSQPPAWIRLFNTTSTVQPMRFTADGNTLFFGTQNGDLFRIDGISQLRRSHATAFATDPPDSNVTVTLIGQWSNRSINDIAVDPNNNNSVVVVLGNYGNQTYIFKTSVAMTATDNTSAGWVSKQGSGTNALPKMPVYSVMIDKTDGKRVLLGTEYGIYSTENINSVATVWSSENNGFPRVPVYMIRQQHLPNNWDRKILNSGCVYVGTHGRGIWKSCTLGSPDVAVEEKEDDPATGLVLYPNPASSATYTDLILGKNTEVRAKIYDMKGTLVREENFGSLGAGSHKLRFNTSLLSNGAYLVILEGDEFRYTNRLNVVK